MYGNFTSKNIFRIYKMNFLHYENHMLKNTNYYLLCTIYQLEKSHLTKINNLIQECNEFSETSKLKYDEIDEIKQHLKRTEVNREILQHKLNYTQENHDFVYNQLQDIQKKHDTLHNQLQDTQDKHDSIHHQLEENLVNYTELENQYKKALEEQQNILEKLNETTENQNTLIRKLEEKNRNYDELQSQTVRLMIEMENQRNSLENRINELQKTKDDLQKTLEKTQSEKEFLENNSYPIDSVNTEKLLRENAELHASNFKLQNELVHIIAP